MKHKRIIELINEYVKLQIIKPLALDKKEPKLYSKGNVEIYKEYDGDNYILVRLLHIMEEEVKTNSDIKWMYGSRIYSRTEFFRELIWELVKDYNIDEIKQEILDLKLYFKQKKNYGYTKVAIDKLFAKAILIKKIESSKQKIGKKLIKTLKK